jgi:hypothetical protein
MTAPASDGIQEDHRPIHYEETTELSQLAGDADYEHQPWFR